MLEITLKRVWVEYPIPSSVSIWGPDAAYDPAHPTDLTNMIELCLDELQSDLEITASTTIYGNAWPMPAGCRNIVSVKLAQNFQGNKAVKKSYDSINNILNVRYFPAIVKYHRNVTLKDLDTLKGDLLIYFKAYLLWKMATKELVILSSIDLQADNGDVNLDALKAFADSCKDTYDELKPEILLYVNGN